jgi:hypothetical protein
MDQVLVKPVEAGEHSGKLGDDPEPVSRVEDFRQTFSVIRDRRESRYRVNASSCIGRRTRISVFDW